MRAVTAPLALMATVRQVKAVQSKNSSLMFSHLRPTSHSKVRLSRISRRTRWGPGDPDLEVRYRVLLPQWAVWMSRIWRHQTRCSTSRLRGKETVWTWSGTWCRLDVRIGNCPMIFSKRILCYSWCRAQDWPKCVETNNIYMYSRSSFQLLNQCQQASPYILFIILFIFVLFISIRIFNIH